MGRTRNKSTASAKATSRQSRSGAKSGAKARGRNKGYSILDDDDRQDGHEESDLPKDEAGRRKIKRQYENLLGIRVEKLKGRILNRERINKTIEGVYFICAICKRICHNMDDGFVEDPANQNNLCGACAKAKGKTKQVAA